MSITNAQIHPAYRTGYRIGLTGADCDLPDSVVGMVTTEHIDLFVEGWFAGHKVWRATRAN
jgi:hypothetical protein